MKTNYLKLIDNEEVYIINPQSNSTIHIKRIKDRLYITDIESYKENQDIKIIDLDSKDQKKYVVQL